MLFDSQLENASENLKRFGSGTSSTLPGTNNFISTVASTVIRVIISGLNSVQQVTTDVSSLINGIIASIISFLNGLLTAL